MARLNPVPLSSCFLLILSACQGSPIQSQISSFHLNSPPTDGNNLLASLDPQEAAARNENFVRQTLLKGRCPEYLGKNTSVPCYMINKTCYCFATFGLGEQTSWAVADKFCRDHAMNLVSIESQTEHELLVIDIKRQGLLDYFFLTSGRKYDNVWKWAATGEVIEYTNWYPGEPNDMGGNHREEALNLYEAFWDTQMRWNDIRLDFTGGPAHKLGFICEW